MSFSNLHVHTHYSQMDSTAKIPELMQRVKDIGQTAVAITDHGTISGLMEGYEEAKKLGIKFVFGVEGYFTPELGIKDRTKTFHMCLYAKNEIGWYNLKKLVSVANLSGFYYDPRFDWDLLKMFHEGLVCTTACMGGILKHEHALGWCIMLRDLFGEDFYIAVHTNDLPEQREFNIKAVDMAKEIGVKIIAEVDSHYVSPKDYDTYKAFTGIRNSNYTTSGMLYLMEEAKVSAVLNPQIGIKNTKVAISSTQEIVDKCNVEIKMGGVHYPLYKQPANFPTQLDYLKHLVAEGWKEKVVPILQKDKSLLKTYRERVKYELETLEKAGYINYFCIGYDLCNWCNSNNVRVGVGRGSVGGSLIAYLIGISGLDPIKYDLVFERFVHLERSSPPDVDLDFARSQRQRVIEYIKNTYGSVYQVRTFGIMQDKGALQRAGQALGVLPAIINEMSKKMTKLEDLYGGVVDLAKEFRGVCQNFGVHASAVVIFPDDPCNYTSIEMQGGANGTPVVAFDMKYIEAMGCLKQDILGLKTLDVIDDCLKLANLPKNYVDNLPDTDKKTFDMLCDGNTSGCFQIESAGMTQLVKNLQPREFADLIPLVALYRPGTLKSGMVDVFINRRKGLSPIEYPHHSLENILKPTYGVILYQEQIMKICQTLGGYTLGQADVLRRAIGKKKADVMAKEESVFLGRCLKNGIDEQTIHTVWDLIKTFAEYGFNQAHSASYGYIAYQTAFLKANHTLEYMCALLNSEIGDTEKTGEYVNEAKALGIAILPPSIEHPNVKWSIENGALRVGLSCIKGVGEIVINPSNDLDSFLENNQHLNRRELLALNSVGALGDNIKENADTICKYLAVKPKIENAKQKIEEWKAKGNDKKVQEWETKLQTLMLNGEPYAVLTEDIQEDVSLLGFRMKDVRKEYDVRLHNGTSVLVGDIMAVKVINDKNGKQMAFVKILTINDKEMELVIFSSIYGKLSCKLEKNKSYTFAVNGNKVTSVAPTLKK